MSGESQPITTYTIFVLISVGYRSKLRILVRVYRFCTWIALAVSMHTEEYDIT
jgi:hypothetical protein